MIFMNLVILTGVVKKDPLISIENISNNNIKKSIFVLGVKFLSRGIEKNLDLEVTFWGNKADKVEQFVKKDTFVTVLGTLGLSANDKMSLTISGKILYL